MKRYKKKKTTMIDLSDRKNIRIVTSEEFSVSDSYIEFLKEQIENRTKKYEDFNDYVIKKEIESKRHISDEEFSNTMNELIKQHKLLKCMLKEQG